MENKLKEYNTKEIANICDIAESTVRKYAQTLEKSGYTFTRNESGYRVFTERDLMTINKFKRLSKEGKPLSEITKKIISESDTQGEKALESSVSDDIVYQLIEKVDQLEEQNKQLLYRAETQEQFNEELLKRLEQMNDHISKRDQSMMSAIRDIQETKKLIASAQEEKKKSFLARLFGK